VQKLAKQGKKEFTLTASGYEYDKELSKISINAASDSNENLNVH
jgi:hypothetical protein